MTRNTGMEVLFAAAVLGVLGACGEVARPDEPAAVPADTTVNVDQLPSTTSPQTVVMSDGSICKPLEGSPPAGTDIAVGTASCSCPVDLFSDQDPPICFPRQLSTWKYPGGNGPTGKSVGDLKVDELGFKPMLPQDLEIHATSTSNFSVSGTYPGLGRLIVTEVGYEPLLGGGLQDEIARLSTAPGNVAERLADDDMGNDAIVIDAGGTPALVGFPQTLEAKGQPTIETVDWIANDTRYVVTIQLGQQALLHGPTYDSSIVKFIEAFAPVS